MFFSCVTTTSSPFLDCRAPLNAINYHHVTETRISKLFKFYQLLLNIFKINLIILIISDCQLSLFQIIESNECYPPYIINNILNSYHVYCCYKMLGYMKKDKNQKTIVFLVNCYSFNLTRLIIFILTCIVTFMYPSFSFSLRINLHNS